MGSQGRLSGERFMAHTAEVAAALNRRLQESTVLVARWTSDPHWRPPCATCIRPKGYIRVMLPGEKDESLVGCPRRDDPAVCRLAAVDAQEALRLRRVRLMGSGLLPRYHTATVDRLNPAVRKEVVAYLRDLDEHITRGHGLLLLGGLGTGKTMALGLIAMRADEIGVRFGFAHAGDVYSAMRRRDPAAHEYLDGLRRAKLLLFDEFASPFTSDLTIGDLEALFEHRHAAMRATCIATQLSVERLKALPEWARIYDRLREDCWPPGKAIVIPGGSRRGQT